MCSAIVCPWARSDVIDVREKIAFASLRPPGHDHLDHVGFRWDTHHSACSIIYSVMMCVHELDLNGSNGLTVPPLGTPPPKSLSLPTAAEEFLKGEASRRTSSTGVYVPDGSRRIPQEAV